MTETQADTIITLIKELILFIGVLGGIQISAMFWNIIKGVTKAKW